MKTTKNAPTSDSRFTTAVPPPNAASARTPEPEASGIASVSATMAAISRSSLVASRRSRFATSAALRRSSFGQLMVAYVVADDREIDVLQGWKLDHLLARLQARATAQFDHAADGECAPGGHDPYFAGQCFGFVHAVGADHERAAFLLEVLEVRPGPPGAVGVERGGGLVGADQARAVEGRPDERDLLAHSLRVGAEPAVARVAELEELEKVVDPAPAQRGLHVVDGPEVVEVGPRRHALVEPRHLGHQPDAGANRGRIVGGVDAVDAHGPRGRDQHARHAAERGRLARPVAAQQDEALALFHPDCQVAERKHVAIALGETFDFEHG